MNLSLVNDAAVGDFAIVPDLLLANVRMIHGPGCPVCVLPIPRGAKALQLALEHRVILCTYGDMLRVPGPQRQTMLKAKANGADVRMVSWRCWRAWRRATERL